MSIYADLFTSIDTSLASYVSSTSASVITWLTPVFSNLLIIYIAMLGYAHMMGAVEEPLLDAFKRVVRIGIILTLALSVGTYSSVIVDFLYNGPEQLAAVLTGTPPGATLLDDLYKLGFEIGDRAWDEGGILDGDFGMYMIAVIMWIGTIILTAYAAFLLLMAKVALSVLLAVGPIFIVLALFPTTQRFFDAWIAMTINYGLLVVLAIAVVQIIVGGLFAPQLTAIHAAGGVSTGNVLNAIILVTVSTLILRQVSTISSALGGGIALATQGVMGSASRKLGRGASKSGKWAGRNTGRGVAKSYRAGKALYQRRFRNTVAGR